MRETFLSDPGVWKTGLMLYFVHNLPGQWSSQAKMDKAFWEETSKLGYNNIVFTVYRKNGKQLWRQEKKQNKTKQKKKRKEQGEKRPGVIIVPHGHIIWLVVLKLHHETKIVMPCDKKKLTKKKTIKPKRSDQAWNCPSWKKKPWL